MVHPIEMTPLNGWQNFYVIVGSSAGALIGLQFVVLSFIAGLRGNQPINPGGGAFSTPTIVHFGVVLGLAALLCAPWEDAAGAAVVWGLCGLSGIGYMIANARRIQKQSTYRPVFEDWLFHAVLPLLAYTALAVTAITAFYSLRQTLYGVAAAALVLLFSGIHNAWDAVAYHAFQKRD
jgi:hypothetical protein